MVPKTNASTKDIREPVIFSKYSDNLKEITEYIGMHNNTVSRGIKTIEGEDKM